MTVKIIRDRTAKNQLRDLALETYREMVKAVADVRRDVIAAGGELHADAEAELLKDGSCQKDLWGFNIYLDAGPDEALEFSSLINIRPSENKSLQIKDPAVKDKISGLVERLIDWKD